MKCYIGPFIWDIDHYRGPNGTNTVIDLRNQSQMSQSNQIGMGIFEGNIDDSNYEFLGDCTDNSSARIQSAWESLTDYQPKGDTISDLIFDHLTEGADPKHLDQPKPLMPKTGHRLNVYLGDQVIKTKRFNFRESPETNKIQTVLQNDYREIYDKNHGMRRKFIGFYERKFRIPNFHNHIIPNDLPKEKAEKPTTIISDNFNGTDDPAVGKQLTWVEGGGGSHWDNFSNQARRITITAGADDSSCRATTPLSGADQSAEVTIVDNDIAGEAGATCRRSSSDVTYYLAANAAGASIQLWKVVLGTRTNISTAEIITGLGAIKLEVIGSDIKSYLGTPFVLKNSVTDTSITGNLFCGIYGFYAMTTKTLLDNFSAQDIGTPSGGSSTLLLMGI